MLRVGLAVLAFGVCGLVFIGCRSTAPDSSQDIPPPSLASPQPPLNSATTLDGGEMLPPLPPFELWTLEQDRSLELSITAVRDGSLTGVEVSKSSGVEALDESARSWVAKKWRMPRAKQGEPEQRKFLVPFVYPKQTRLVGQYPEPPYPREALIRRRQGSILVRLIVDKTGRIESASIVRSSRYKSLDEPVVRWIKEKWKFPAGTLREYIIPFEFALK